jgi:hypothetical protein
VFWDVTLNDIKVKVKLYIGQQQAQIVQQFQTLEKVVSLAFGPGEKEKPKEVQSKDELKTKFSAVFGGG